MLEYDGVRILFTGDCSEDGETLLVQELARRGLTCQILKAGHHGSSNATGDALLEQLSPQAAIISCGVQNRYRHPHPEMLERVRNRHISCFVTAQCGAVTLEICDGKAALTTMLAP